MAKWCGDDCDTGGEGAWVGGDTPYCGADVPWSDPDIAWCADDGAWLEDAVEGIEIYVISGSGECTTLYGLKGGELTKYPVVNIEQRIGGVWTALSPKDFLTNKDDYIELGNLCLDLFAYRGTNECDSIVEASIDLCASCGGADISGTTTVGRGGVYQYTITGDAGAVTWAAYGVGASIDQTGLLTVAAWACGTIIIRAVSNCCGTLERRTRVVDSGYWDTVNRIIICEGNSVIPSESCILAAYRYTNWQGSACVNPCLLGPCGKVVRDTWVCPP